MSQTPPDAALLAAKRRCDAARWPEHHDPNCAWCASLSTGPTTQPT